MTSLLQTVDHDFVQAFADRWHAAWNAHDPAAVAALCDPGVVLEQTGSPVRHGRPGVETSVAELVRASGDFRFEEAAPACLSPDGRTAIMPWRFTGTMTGPLSPPGFAPTGRVIAFEGTTSGSGRATCWCTAGCSSTPTTWPCARRLARARLGRREGGRPAPAGRGLGMRRRGH